MTRDPNDPNRDHPETTDDRPGDNPQAAKEEAENLRPNPDAGNSAENILDSEYASSEALETESQPRRAPALTNPEDNARVDRVLPDEPHTGAVAVVPQERAYLVSPRTLRRSA